MAYLLLKSIHIFAAIAWVSGMLLDALLVGVSDQLRRLGPGLLLRSAAALVARWDRRCTVPAMVLVWIAGITLAIWGGWFNQPWFAGKLGAVILLTGLHGVLSGRLRQLAAGGDNEAGLLRSAPLIAACLVATAVTLVVLKPM